MCVISLTVSGSGAGPYLAYGDIERFGIDVLLGEVRDRTLDTGCHRVCDVRLSEVEVDQVLELGGEIAGPLRGDVDREHLDRDQLPVLGIFRAKDGSEHAGTYLVLEPKTPECRRRRVVGD